MARFLRDEYLTNLTLTEERLRHLDSVFRGRRKVMPEQAQPKNGQNQSAFLFYVIRFDNKGYRVFSIEDLIAYFRQASYVERVIFTLESGPSLGSNRNVGSYMELRLDEKEPNLCFLQVSSDDSDWVDSSFSAVKEVLDECKNRNSLARSVWSQMVIQMGGVFMGFLLSLWAAVKMSPFIAIENAFFITFLFALLVFSNLWSFLNQRLVGLVNSTFPNLRFYRPDQDKMHWLLQAVIGGMMVALFLFLLNLLFGYVGRVLGEFFANRA